MNKDIKQRFVDDFKIPIPVFEDPYWEFYLSLYEKEFQARTYWEKLMQGIEEEYQGNTSEFLRDFYALRESLINAIKDCPDYQRYNEGPVLVLKPNFGPNVKKDDIYNEGFLGGPYWSVDLKKANVQAFCSISPNFFNGTIGLGSRVDKVYTEWVLSHVGDKKTLTWYAPMSKYMRQVIFGNCNPKRQIKIEEGLVGEAAHMVLDFIGREDTKVISYGSDEVVLKVSPEVVAGEAELNEIECYILDRLHTEVRVEPFTLSSLEFENATGNKIRAYKKTYLRPGRGVEYKGISRHYYAQIFEQIHNIPVDPDGKDLVFYQEKEPAKFANRLKFIGENHGV